MAIKFKPRETIEIKSIDLQPKKALGVRLPFSPFGDPFTPNYTTRDQIKSNLVNMLLTNPGERFNEPTFGVGVFQQLFEQEINSEVLKTKIQRQTELFIPEIEVSQIQISQNEHKALFKVFYTILANNIIDAVTITLN
jgi:phage baseplate assembly protein W|tara:strand:- start:8448 stop:8861 length:414 start_codon:yes stop_codon:yes gene_type:complete